MTDYTQLITSEHRVPKFIALVSLLTSVIDANAQLLANMPTLFDVDVAIDDQLDKVGQWIGLSRYISPSITNVFFAFDDSVNGFDSGVWQDANSSLGVSILDNETYRSLLYVKIALNNWDGTASAVITALQKAMPNNSIVVQDNGDMTMYLGVINPIVPLLQALLVRGSFNMQPAGVLMTAIAPSINTSPFFGFDAQTGNVSGFDTGAFSIPLT